MIEYLVGFLSAGVGTYFFCLSMRAPRRAVLPTALLAAIGYTLYFTLSTLSGIQPLAYFAAALLIASGSELLATVMRMPATIFMFPGVVPLVPGIGIYRTMLYLIQKQYDAFLDVGTQTLLALGAMAIAIAMANEVARRIRVASRKRRNAL